MTSERTKRVAAWHHGGTASALAACCTHPLDLLKVHLQTQQQAQLGLIGMGKKVIATEGIMGLYNGISASVGRQLTYSMTRFAAYEFLKNKRSENNRNMPFLEKVAIAAVSGGVGGFVGAPCDLINVRMQNDMKIAADQRRNYRHLGDGLYRVMRYEGITTLFNGAMLASIRAVLMTIGQLAFYDQFKYLLLESGYFRDNLTTHFTASLNAAAVATAITQPFDVMKTRMMNAPKGTYPSIMACAREVFALGPLAFYKGFTPAFTRLGPHTILTFIFFEQLRIRFGKDIKA